MELRHPEHGTVGTVYLDLHPRADKYDHCAHFTIQCGSRRTARRPVIALVRTYLPIEALRTAVLQ
jgi:Zn-dependent oligopeptidase